MIMIYTAVWINKKFNLLGLINTHCGTTLAFLRWLREVHDHVYKNLAFVKQNQEATPVFLYSQIHLYIISSLCLLAS